MPWGSFLADGHTRVISRICLSGKTVLRANDTQAALREPGLTKTCLTGKGGLTKTCLTGKGIVGAIARDP